jgi:undecaprenyl-diphosphatase
MSLTFLLPAVILGALEGLTEFLPISSTGHLIIAGAALDFTGERAKTFQIVIQLGAILAVCWYYRHRLATVIAGFASQGSARRFCINIALAFAPAALLGVMLHGFIKDHLFRPLTVAAALVLGGIVILVVERVKGAARFDTVDEIGWREALKLGCAQAFALIPGTSRSGATIVGGLIFGLSRPAATEFSFFLAIPTMFAATGYELLTHWHLLRTADLVMVASGFTTAFVCGLIAVSALIRYVKNHSFCAFAYYRIVFGFLVFAYFWT